MFSGEAGMFMQSTPECLLHARSMAAVGGFREASRSVRLMANALEMYVQEPKVELV